MILLIRRHFVAPVVATGAAGSLRSLALFLPPFWRGAFWDGVWHEIKWYAFMAKEPRK